MNMAFFENISLIDWLLVFLIIIFLLMILRNVYRLMKRRNEYLSYKEAKAQYNQQHQEHLQSEEKAVNAQFEDSEKESEENN